MRRSSGTVNWPRWVTRASAEGTGVGESRPQVRQRAVTPGAKPRGDWKSSNKTERGPSYTGGTSSSASALPSPPSSPSVRKSNFGGERQGLWFTPSSCRGEAAPNDRPLWADVRETTSKGVEKGKQKSTGRPSSPSAESNRASVCAKSPARNMSASDWRSLGERIKSRREPVASVR